MDAAEGGKKNISEGAFVPEKCSRAVTELLCLILNNSGGGGSTERSRGPTWTKLNFSEWIDYPRLQNGANRSICALFQYKRVGFPNAAIYTAPPDFVTSKRLRNEASVTTVAPRQTAHMDLGSSFIFSVCLRSFPSTWKQKYH